MKERRVAPRVAREPLPDSGLRPVPRWPDADAADRLNEQ